MIIERYDYAVPSSAAKLRQEIFVDEQGFIDEFDEYDEKSVHLVMLDGVEPVATLRFYCEGGGSYHVGRVAVKKERRGEGLGRVLMDEAKAVIRSLGGSSITVGAQEDKAGFYASCGYEQYGERYFEQDYPHVNMKTVL